MTHHVSMLSGHLPSCLAFQVLRASPPCSSLEARAQESLACRSSCFPPLHTPPLLPESLTPPADTNLRSPILPVYSAKRNIQLLCFLGPDF